MRGSFLLRVEVGRYGCFADVAFWCDRYPPKMIPAMDIVVCTTATNDKDARLLLSSMGVPFYGKHVN